MEIVGYKTYIASAGDRFDTISFKYYGTEFLADKLMKENPAFVACLIFKGGEVLTIPIFDDIESKETLAPWRR
ncbi:MAG: LysM domain-containing protein [Clostridia bacterium]|nr:LysM domain-containing protein [Clostridia bacterium]